MTDLPPIANFISYCLIILLIITFLYALSLRFVSDETLYDLTILPSGDPRKLNYYIEPSLNSNEPIPFPSVFNMPEVYVTFVVPAYNEEQRLPLMLDDTLRYLQSREMSNPQFTWEIIVVDDGSKDRTSEIVIGYARQNHRIRLLRQPYNMGKGAAIQAGALHSRGKLILMVDADGATKIDEFGELERKIKQPQEINKEAVVVGSRSHLLGENKANRTAIRDFLGKSFHLLISLTGVKNIQDTQCGFKLFSREAARWLFPNQHIKRWCFDPELLVIAQKCNMLISEVPVEWNEIEGSKMKLMGMVKMALDLLQIAVYYPLGLWTIKMKSDFSHREDEL
ncbi:glycosyl transferase [Tritrichomonas foetus]|uniref:dolichyl-phosphate beta-glucosyltransferase n=1 Tax=Tritrichomonas foetus TaxID=1144522 RepID=A0A1J4KKV9_9EUKA|nr:glycosyl transferase [Tritrichomonas foetus]|eukprot:OHT11778.1 glycosyl transferase [Tritrichomonas foetus]